MPEKIFYLQPWSPESTRVAQGVTDEVRALAPELDVLFMGSAALGLPGKNDIDMDVLCRAEDVASYTEKLAAVLGEPKDTDAALTVWEFAREGFEVDIILSDPSVSHVPKQRATFEKLRSSPELLEEYKKLKEACDGLPYEEYEKRKTAFLDGKVLADRKQ